MKQLVEGTVFTMILDKYESTFVNKISYNTKNQQLAVSLSGTGTYFYSDVPMETFLEFTVADSFGTFYNSKIKNKFMAKATKKQEETKPVEEKRKPKKINKASDDYRWIELDINLSKVDKRFLVVGEKSGNLFLKARMRMEPDGEVDKYGNLGFISQVVPTEIYKKDKNLRGEILGNACELVWDDREEETTRTVSDDDDIGNGLPF